MSRKSIWSSLSWSIPIIVLLVFGIPATSCGTSGNPAAPGLTVQNSGTFIGRESSHGILWYGLISVDLTNETVEMFPVRNTDTHFNVRTFAEEGPCTDCLSVTDFSVLPGDVLSVEITITHPFPGLKKFSGFDVRGIVMFNGSEVWPSNDLAVPRSALGDGELLNPDGYTRLYNMLEFPPGSMGTTLWEYSKGKLAPDVAISGSLNGYRAYLTDNERRCFFTTDLASQTFEIAKPEGPFIFGYALDASWAKPDPALSGIPVVLDVPGDFFPEANCDEAYMLSTGVIGELYDNGNGVVELIVDVYDWQHDAESAGVSVECPDLFNGLVELNLDSGVSIAYTRFIGEITNDLTAPIGEYIFLVAAEDVNDASSPLPLTAYDFGTFTVVEQQDDPIAIGACFPVSAGMGELIHFFDDGSYDPDGGSITQVEWDWGNDGTFDVIANEDWHSWDVPGMHQVQMRVTDDDGATGILDEPLEVLIYEEIPQPELIDTLLGFHSPYCAKVDTNENTCWVDCTQAAPVKDFGFYRIDNSEQVEKVFEKAGSGFMGMPALFGLNVEARELIAPDVLGIFPNGCPVDVWHIDFGSGDQVVIPIEEENELAFMMDGELFYDLGTAVVPDCSPANRLVTWDYNDSDPVFTDHPAGAFPSLLEADYENHRLFVFCDGSSDETPKVQVWDAVNWEVTTEFDTYNITPPFMTDIDYDPAYNRIYFGCGDDSLEIWNSETYEFIDEIHTGGTEIAGVDHMGGGIYVSYQNSSGDGCLAVYDAVTFEKLWEVACGIDPKIVACNPNTGKIYVPDMSGGAVYVFQG